MQFFINFGLEVNPVEDIEIKYNRKKSNLTLIIGIVSLLLFIASILYNKRPAYIGLILGVFNLATYYIRKHYNYLTVKDGIIKKTFGSKIPLDEVVDTRRFTSEYVFRSKRKKIVLDKDIIDEDSVEDVENLINNLRERQFDYGK